MFEKEAKQTLGVFGKRLDAFEGSATVEQLPASMAFLGTAIVADRPVALAELLERSLMERVSAVGRLIAL
jgi:hypothetical protein